METDDRNSKQDGNDETDQSWVYSSLPSYGKLMDHLVTSSSILSLFTKHLTAQPLIIGDIPFPRDAGTFIKALQSMVLKVALPVWTNPQFANCSYDLSTKIISIIWLIYFGVEVKNGKSNAGAQLTGHPPNETTISIIVEMSFPKFRAEKAVQ